MPFKLEIEFAGLCLFVGRSVDESRQMHVLMPSVLGAHHGASRHIPVLKFDTAHLRENSTNYDGVSAQVLMRSKQWVVAGETAGLSVCSQLVPLRPVTQRGVLPHLLEARPGPLLASRVTLGHGEMVAVARGACWEWDPGQARRLSHRARWEIQGMPDEPLRITLFPLDSSSVITLPNLYPLVFGEERIMRLKVHHMTPDDLAVDRPTSGAPPVNSPAWHFEAYYPLFGPQTPIRLPRSRPDAECASGGGCPEWVDSGETAFNCMLAAEG